MSGKNDDTLTACDFQEQIPAQSTIRSRLCETGKKEAPGKKSIGNLPTAIYFHHAIRWIAFAFLSLTLFASCKYVSGRPQATESPTATVESMDLEWKMQSTGNSPPLNSVFFADANTGWAVGYEGTILKTTNAGAQWESRPSGTGTFLWGVFFIDRQTGWAVGGDFTDPEVSGTVLKTVDGGETWFHQNPGTTAALSAVYFVDANHGWAVGGKNNDPDPGVLSGQILVSADGGTTWVEQRKDASHRFFSVYFVDPKTGWVVGDEGNILKTTDGGLTWNLQFSSLEYGLWSVYFLDANRGWAVGYPGVILRTTDGGATWTEERRPGEIFSSVYFSDPDNGWVVGGMGQGDPAIFRSINGGATWTPQSLDLHDLSLHSVFLINGDTGWAVGTQGTSGAILKFSPGKNPLDLFL